MRAAKMFNTEKEQRTQGTQRGETKLLIQDRLQVNQVLVLKSDRL